MERNKGKIITVTSTKGGVGKTITTLNLAGVFSNLKKKVLVIDFDLYGGAVATYLNSKNDKTLFNLITDLSNNKYRSIDDYIYKHNEYISILSAPKDPRFANKMDSKYISIILNNVVYKYDVILIDTTHILNEINIYTLDMSDVILYMFTNDSFDLKNTKSFLTILKDAGFNNFYTVLNESIFKDKTYFSKYDIRTIIKNNIDFTISKNMYIKNIDKYIMEGEILVLNPSLSFKDKKDYKKYLELALTLIKDKEKK